MRVPMATPCARSLLRVTALAAVLALASDARLVAQATPVTVTSLDIRGAEGFSESRLTSVLATEETGPWPWSREHLFDRGTFESDLDRLTAFYADHGYPDARVTGVDTTLSDDQASIAITITIDEGQPERIASVALDGFDPIEPERRERLRTNLPLQPGDIRTVAAVDQARSMAARAVADLGYPQAQVTVDEREVGDRRIAVTLTATPGPHAVFGEIAIDGNASVGDEVIDRVLLVEPGRPYSVTALQQSQRRLYDLDLFQVATVEARPEAAAPDRAPVQVSVVEGRHRRIELSGGYGADEHLRGGLSWRHLNFFGGARTASLEGKWSSLDRGVRATLTQPHALAPNVALTIGAQRWFADEPAYRLDTRGGSLALTRQFFTLDAAGGRNLTSSVSVSLRYEEESFAITPDALTDLSFRDELIALGLDPRTGTGRGRLTALAFDLRTTTVVDPLDSRQGYLFELHLEKGGGWLPGHYGYLETTAEARHFLPVGDAVVVANRLRVGSLGSNGPLADNVPFFKRYFLGGSASLRGWGRYQVAPLSGSGLPLGGHSLAEASSELRVDAFERITLVAFVDAGNVWPESWHAPWDLRYDVGPGVRYDTPIGPLRADFAYQLTPIEGLLIDGEPESRRWRFQFSIGQAF